MLNMYIALWYYLFKSSTTKVVDLHLKEHYIVLLTLLDWTYSTYNINYLYLIIKFDSYIN